MSGGRGPGTRRPRVVLLVAVLVLGTVAVLVVGARLTSTPGFAPDVPAAAAPRDLCAVVGGPTLRRVVVDPEEVPAQVYSSTTAANGDAGCGAATATERARRGTYGLLRVRLLRLGGVGGHAPVRRARETVADRCASLPVPATPSPVPGLGDASCSATDAPGGERAASTSLRVRRGSDVVEVDHAVRPGGAAAAERGAARVARRVLAGT